MPNNDVEANLKSVLGKDLLMDARRHMLALVRHTQALIRIVEILLETLYGEKVRH